jgi:ABC-type Mn2+/Zn2+ transport system ATPase subunit
MRLLDRINRTGTTVIVATHDAGMVDQMRRRVIELDRGILVRDQAHGVYGIETATTAATSGSPAGPAANVPSGAPARARPDSVVTRT